MDTPSRYTAATLGMFLGSLGLHQFYIGHNRLGALWLTVCVLASWTVVVPIALAILGFMQGMSYLLYDEHVWVREYSNSK